MSVLNCWEYFHCERIKGPDGEACPAATQSLANGLNRGHNGGRACWALAHTLCAGKVQGSISEKMETCMKCEFRKLVVEEEQDNLKSFREILDAIKTG